MAIKARKKLPYKNRRFLETVDKEKKRIEIILNEGPLMGDFVLDYLLGKYNMLYPFKYLVLNDLLKIVAEYQIKYDPTLTIKENFKKLDTYQKKVDIFTGEPYKINPGKGYIYSIGINAFEYKNSKELASYESSPSILMRFK